MTAPRVRVELDHFPRVNLAVTQTGAPTIYAIATVDDQAITASAAL